MIGQFLWINGRNGRLQWWMTQIVQISVLLLSLPFLLPDGFAGLADMSDSKKLETAANASPLLLPVFLVIVWIGLVNNIRRYHDRDKSGWWLLFGFIPLIGPLWQFIELGFLAGTPGDNDFGSHGGGSSVADEIENLRSNGLAKVDDNYLADYARRYAAEQSAKDTPAAAAALAPISHGFSPGSGTFGKRR